MKASSNAEWESRIRALKSSKIATEHVPPLPHKATINSLQIITSFGSLVLSTSLPPLQKQCFIDVNFCKSNFFPVFNFKISLGPLTGSLLSPDQAVAFGEV